MPEPAPPDAVSVLLPPAHTVTGLAAAVGVVGKALMLTVIKSVLEQVPKVAVTANVAVPEDPGPAVIVGFATEVELNVIPAQLLQDQL